MESRECTSRDGGAFSPPARGGAAVSAAEAAFDALRVDPQRTRAALFCVAAGMAVIVSLVSIVSGGRHEMLRAVEAAGPSNVFLKKAAGGHAPLTTSRLASARADVAGLAATGAVRASSAAVSAGRFRETAPLYAVSAGVFDAFPFRVFRGRSLGALDFSSRAPRALLGARLYRALEASGDPLGKTLEVGGESFEIVGGLEPIAVDSGTAGTLSGLDWNRAVILPLGAEPGRVNAPDDDTPVDLVVLRFADPTAAARGAALLSSMPRDGIAVVTPEQALAGFRAAHRSLDRIAWLVSCLTAASAAFGITNLLRASVRSRAAEIGLRRAVGARSHDIRRQFLCEGLLLGLLGGALGLLLGASASLTLLSRAGFAPRFDAATLGLLSVGAAVFGVASGLSPAAEAARLDPGAALRAE